MESYGESTTILEDGRWRDTATPSLNVSYVFCYTILSVENIVALSLYYILHSYIKQGKFQFIYVTAGDIWEHYLLPIFTCNSFFILLSFTFLVCLIHAKTYVLRYK